MSMKSEKMYNGITNIDDEMIEQAQESTEKAKKHIKWLPWAGAAAAACIGLGVGIPAVTGIINNGNRNMPNDGETIQVTEAGQPAVQSALGMMIAKPEYPEIPPYPEEDRSPNADWDSYKTIHDNWWQSIRELRNQPDGYTDGTDTFFRESIKELMKDNEGKNRVYSPLSVFMALSMSAEISGGNTRQQILDLLGQDSIESLRSHANSIWQANYMDDGMAKCVLANSIWLNKDISYKQETMNRLAIDYYSSSFVGEPGSGEYDKLLQGWLNEQTDGMLESYADGIRLDPGTVIALASTVDYAGKWNHKFNKDLTESGIFHSPDGDITCDFMNAPDTDMGYWWSDKFGAVSLGLENNGNMRLILPDEGITPEELLADDKTIDFLTSSENGIYKNFDNTFAQVTLSVPKFDVSSSMSLTEELKKLGITDAFDGSVSDFSPLTESDDMEIFISSATHAARVEIDEEGCRAAALTVMAYMGAAMPDGHVDFILDRPFIFEIMSQTGLPLFVGIVNNPAQ